MRTLVVLVATVAMLAGWSGAEAAEARITDFAFSCETPEGRKLKPKFGDVEGVFYTDIPGQRQQCVEAVKRKIALCRENTDFASNTRNEKYAECLPIFRAQAKACVGHFQRELVKCDGGGRESASAVRLDPGERRRIQGALAADGFDPGPADGKSGPRTRRAIQAWQRANGYAATGALTARQAQALLGGAAPLKPFGPNWIIAENQRCQLHNPYPEPGVTITWSGDCVDGKASGEGRVVWRRSYGEDVYEGGYRDGKAHGHGTYTQAGGTRYEGQWRDGQMNGPGNETWPGGGGYVGEYRDGHWHGHGTVTYPSGSRYEGEWRTTKPHGWGAYISADGRRRYEGNWTNGCFEQGGRTAWIETTKQLAVSNSSPNERHLPRARCRRFERRTAQTPREVPRTRGRGRAPHRPRPAGAAAEHRPPAARDRARRRGRAWNDRRRHRRLPRAPRRARRRRPRDRSRRRGRNPRTPRRPRGHVPARGTLPSRQEPAMTPEQLYAIIGSNVVAIVVVGGVSGTFFWRTAGPLDRASTPTGRHSSNDSPTIRPQRTPIDVRSRTP